MTRMACTAMVLLQVLAAAIALIMALYTGLYFHWAMGAGLFFVFCACVVIMLRNFLVIKKPKVHINDLPYESHEDREVEEEHR